MPISRPAMSGVSAQADLSHRWRLAFLRMWAIAHITHLSLADRQALDTVPAVAAFAAAFVLLVRPDKGIWVAALAVTQLVDLLVEMPLSPDHWMLAGFVNLAILLSMCQRRSAGPEAIVAAFPAVRWLLLIGYAAAALSKYNTTFLDAAQSCATAMARVSSFGLTERLAGPQWFLMTVAAETAIPILLLIPRTRRHGVRLGMLFHLMLTISPVVAVEDFSAALYALFFLFLADEDADRLLGRLRAVADKSAVVRDARRFPWVFAGAGFVVLGFSGHAIGRGSSGFMILFSALYLVAVLAAAIASWRGTVAPRSIGTPSWFFLPLIACLVLWAANPYLGFRTTGAFTMFSSLRTEGDVGNHLFMPSYRVVDWQEDLVIVESSNDEALKDVDPGRLGIPLVGLRRMAMDDPDLVVTGELHGRTITWGPEEGQTAFEPLPWWQRKFFLLRPVPVDDRPYCTQS